MEENNLEEQLLLQQEDIALAEEESAILAAMVMESEDFRFEASQEAAVTEAQIIAAHERFAKEAFDARALAKADPKHASRQRIAQVGKDQASFEHNRDGVFFTDTWAASAARATKDETLLENYIRIKEEKRKRLLAVGIGDMSDPNFNEAGMGTGDEVAETAAFNAMSQKEQRASNDAWAQKNGFKDMDDFDNQAMDYDQGSGKISAASKAFDNMTKKEFERRLAIPEEQRGEGDKLTFDTSRTTVAGERRYQAKLQGRDLFEERSALEDAAEKEFERRKRAAAVAKALARPDDPLPPDSRTGRFAKGTPMGDQKFTTLDKKE